MFYLIEYTLNNVVHDGLLCKVEMPNKSKYTLFIRTKKVRAGSKLNSF